MMGCMKACKGTTNVVLTFFLQEVGGSAAQVFTKAVQLAQDESGQPGH